MTSKHHPYDNGLPLTEKRTYDNASLTSPASNDPPRKRCASNKLEHKDVDYTRDPANGTAMGDSGNSPCKSTRGLQKKAFVSENQTVTESSSLTPEFDGINRLTYGSRERRDENETQHAVRLERMRGAVRTLLECVGEDADREGLLDTPSRYAKMLLRMTNGYQANVQDVVNNALFCEGHSDIVIVKDIDIFSLCEHHLLPFTGKMHIGYFPSDTVIGLSKLARIAEIFSRRLQIQERLTEQVATAVMEILSPQGVAVVMESSHMCMTMRGVEKTSAMTLTSCMRGTFDQHSETRNEFFNLVGMNR